ncbi:hypothetical protein CU098_010207 [Rhizopus stolonifer]|uniref:Uncharacterized protein n=1 Tax=Rhizopus stolonifer TaxID=4846 RepID=A0A367JZ80_RHIST|nr:hypothetical protein CU098_010207 [Rhizopus stolonifer]
MEEILEELALEAANRKYNGQIVESCRFRSKGPSQLQEEYKKHLIWFFFDEYPQASLSD